MALFRRATIPERPSNMAEPAAELSDVEVEQLQHTLNALPDGVVLVDRSGKRILQNAKATAFQGDYQIDALLRATIDNAIQRARSGDYEPEVLEIHGALLHAFEVAAKPLPGQSMVVTIEDVSERRRIDAIRRDFVANVSHELRTPIGALVLLTESLREEHDVDKIQKINEHIASEATRASRLVEELLSLSRLETPETMEQQPVDVGSLLASAVQRVQTVAAQRHVTLTAIDPPRPLTVMGDFENLLSAVVNLLENSVKYSDPNGAVTVHVNDNGATCEIVVTDSGIGIPAAHLDRIFERFYRVDRARSRETGGTGLGLSIVRHVAANHRGEVTVQSREGEGSVFTLKLPVSK